MLKPRSRQHCRVVNPEDARDDPGAWIYEPPTIDGGEHLTLALLEDLSRLLVVHGFPPLRGRALAELTLSLERLEQQYE